MKFNIVARNIEEAVEASDRDEAIIEFVTKMDGDMNAYFKALEDGKREYIINVCNSASDNIFTRKFVGTKEDVKKCLIHLVNEDRGNAPDEWDYGCIDECDIREIECGKLYAYGSYEGYHIDYTAMALFDIEEYTYEV